MRIRFSFDETKCSACGACAVACMDQNDVDVSHGQQPYRRVFQLEDGGVFRSISAACAHCPDAPCAQACPMGCIRYDPDTGLVRVDNRRCVGCRACFWACPHDAPTFRPEPDGRRARMEKCHGCLARIEAGLAPACVKACPTGALTWSMAESGSNGRFDFRSIRPGEAEEAARIEAICFPPNEACSREMMLKRAAAAPELFLVAADRETGKIAGFLNGLSTDETAFRDEFFTDASLFDPRGRTVMLLGLDVLPEYRGRGLARELVSRYADRESARGRTRLVLTCLEEKVAMYEKMGFRDLGPAASTWGGESWHEMDLPLPPDNRPSGNSEKLWADASCKKPLFTLDPQRDELCETRQCFGVGIPAAEQNMLRLADDLRLLSARRTPVLAAIDGRCGAGKSSLAERLSARFDWSVVRMDDFFLRPEQRTSARYDEPGGNVDRERFLEEVLLPLRAGTLTAYRPFNCGSMALGTPILFRETPVVLVEGSYSCHPALWDHYDLHVFLTVDPEEQLRRITARNGEARARDFAEKWIPLEERYFQAFSVEERCEYRFDTTPAQPRT